LAGIQAKELKKIIPGRRPSAPVRRSVTTGLARLDLAGMLLPVSSIDSDPCAA
jgi:hypothetical protein